MRNLAQKRIENVSIPFFSIYSVLFSILQSNAIVMGARTDGQAHGSFICVYFAWQFRLSGLFFFSMAIGVLSIIMFLSRILCMLYLWVSAYMLISVQQQHRLAIKSHKVLMARLFRILIFIAWDKFDEQKKRSSSKSMRLSCVTNEQEENFPICMQTHRRIRTIQYTSTTNFRNNAHKTKRLCVKGWKRNAIRFVLKTKNGRKRTK